jgi:hypothetical protein
MKTNQKMIASFFLIGSICIPCSVKAQVSTDWGRLDNGLNYYKLLNGTGISGQYTNTMDIMGGFLLTPATQPYRFYNAVYLTKASYLSTDGNRAGSTALDSSVFIEGHTFFVPTGDNNTAFIQARRKDNSGSGRFLFRTTDNGNLISAMELKSNGTLSMYDGRVQLIKGRSDDGTLKFNSANNDRWGRIGTSGGGLAIFGGAPDVDDNPAMFIKSNGHVGINIGSTNNNPKRYLEIGQDNAQNTITMMQVHGGAIFNNDADVSRITKVAINTNRYADSAALTVGGPTYIGTWKANEAQRNQNFLSKYMLWVEKGIVTEDLVFAPKSAWADFVFEKNYTLPDLQQLEGYIKIHKHLPGIKSATEVSAEGYSSHDFNKGILQKVEELTLYIINQQKEIDALKKQIKETTYNK